MNLYEFEYHVDPALDAFAGFFAVVLLFLALIVLVGAIVMYVLYSAGLYSIAKRRGIHHAWLSWIPVGSSWLLGSISDQYQYLVKGNSTNRRTTLLVVSIIDAVLYLIKDAVQVGSFVGLATESGTAAGALAAAGLIFGLIEFVLIVIVLVVSFMALYDLYVSCDPSSAAMKMVFSVIFAVTLPFFVFFGRKKDVGMPAKRKPAPSFMPDPDDEEEEKIFSFADPDEEEPSDGDGSDAGSDPMPE